MPDKDIAVLISSSVIPSHPSTAIIEETLASIRYHLPESRVYIMLDGLREEQKDREAAYLEYIKRLVGLSVFKWKNISLVPFEEFTHQAAMTMKTLELVTAPYILFVEHDTPLVNAFIHWDMLKSMLASHATNHIRLHYDETIHPDHQHMMLGNLTPYLIKTNQWHQRPHLASADFYRAKLKAHFSPQCRTFIEDAIYSSCCYGAWEDWKLTVYDPEGTGQNMRRSGHSNGRAGECKFDDRLVF
jgi:hypothetical protein